MQDHTRHSKPSHARSTATHPARVSPNEELVEDSNPGNRSPTLLHSTEARLDPAPQTDIYLGQHGSNQNEGISITSTELSSSTCASHNQLGSCDGPAEPPSDCTSSASRLAVQPKEFTEPSGPRHVHVLRDWKWEILSIFTTLGLLAGILVTLGRYNRGKQPEWPYNININSLTSVLTAGIIAQLGFVLAESTYPSLVACPIGHHKSTFTYHALASIHIWFTQLSASSSGLGSGARTPCRTLSTTTRHRGGFLARSFSLAVSSGSREREHTLIPLPSGAMAGKC